MFYFVRVYEGKRMISLGERELTPILSRDSCKVVGTGASSYTLYEGDFSL